MKFFLDNCLSPKLARALHALSEPLHSISHLQEKFPEGAKDVEWLGTLGREGGWVVISADYRIAKNPQSRGAWKQSGLTAFFFKKGWASQKAWDQAWRMVRRWPDILHTAEKMAPGLGYWVPVNPTGKLQPIGLK